MRARSAGPARDVLIAYLTGARWRGGGALAANGLPPPELPSYERIVAAGAKIGLAFDIRRWDDPELLAAPPKAALIRSCWDYRERAAAFAERLGALGAAGVSVVNPLRAVRWNMGKTYLAEMERAGVATIPTMFVERCDAQAVLRAFDTFDAAELVIKPAIGAGLRQTIRARRNTWSEMDLAAAPLGAASLQPFLPSIEREGERALFFFGGAYAYAVRKQLAPGSSLAGAPGAGVSAYAPSAAERDVAEHALAVAPDGLVYARIDLVTNGLGAPALIELQAIEPQLFLDLAPPGAADAFVRALAAALAPGGGVLER